MGFAHRVNGRVGGGRKEADSKVEHVNPEPVRYNVPAADAVHAVEETKHIVSQFAPTEKLLNLKIDHFRPLGK